MKKRKPTVPRPASETARQALRRVLSQGFPCTVRDLSQEVGLPERKVEEHLEALQKGQPPLIIEPATCQACGFVCKPGLKRPGRCPQCKETRVNGPRFSMAAEE